MWEPYKTQYGTSFGFVKATDTTPPAGYTAEDMIVCGIYTHGHSLRDYGLLPREKPTDETPDIQKDEIEVPGMDGTLDLTEAIDGLVHYENRELEFEFTAVGGRRTWDAIYKRLKNDLHGRKMAVVMDECPDGYYYGRLTVEKPKYDAEKGLAFFTISGDFEPFKYDFSEYDEPWLWDPFSFVDGVIPNHRTYTFTDDPSTTDDRTVVLGGSRMPVIPDIVVSSGSLTVTYIVNGTSKSVPLVVGSNLEKTPDLVLVDGKKTLTFTGNGTMQIKYKVGWL